ncbi:MAG: hypothetical protein KME31_30530 [Tolypothrix carrinoi HA7290-LM1]|jgi:hypothetical protein|nr:hypothetical protein [Tolypothrix carrinoi HA7290-LM1]
MKPEKNPLELTFWEAMGITPIVIDDSTRENLQIGLEQLTEIIEVEVTRIRLEGQVNDE